MKNAHHFIVNEEWTHWQWKVQNAFYISTVTFYMRDYIHILYLKWWRMHSLTWKVHLSTKNMPSFTMSEYEYALILIVNGACFLKRAFVDKEYALTKSSVNCIHGQIHELLWGDNSMRYGGYLRRQLNALRWLSGCTKPVCFKVSFRKRDL